MGTRGIMGVHVDGATKVAYNHWDSYPEELGQQIVTFLLNAGPDLNDVRRQAKRLKAVDDTKAPTAAQRAALADFYDPNVGGPADSTDPHVLWYQYLRGTQGDIGLTLAAGLYEDGRDFANDSLFCEWGYIVNFDDQTLEVYRGFQTEPHSDGRFADPGDAELYTSSAHSVQHLDGKVTRYPAKTYHPIRLVATIPFADLKVADMTSEGMVPDEHREEVEA